MNGSRIRGDWRGRLRVAVAIAILCALVFAAAGGARSEGTGWTVKLKNGSTFTLAPSIQAKAKAGKSINYVFSYGSCSIQGFSEQYQAGYDASIPAANKLFPAAPCLARGCSEQSRAGHAAPTPAATKLYPARGPRLCPPQTQQDVNTQINQIQARLNVNQVDCLAIEPQGSTSMDPLVEA